MLLPSWPALSVQLPTLSSVKVLPLTVQTAGVLELKVTGKPDVELATSAAGVLPRVWLPGEMKVMVCAATTTVKERDTDVAASKLALPAWLALTVQVPTLSSVRLAAAVVHTAGVLETKVTVKPELALATSAKGVVLKVWLPGEVKLRVCVAGGAESPPPPQAPSSNRLASASACLRT